LRDDLARRGITLDIDWLQILQGVASGGREEDLGYWGTVDDTLNLDTGSRRALARQLRRGPRHVELRDQREPPGGYNPSPIDFDHPLDYRMIDGEHDVFGDGAVVLLPTFDAGAPVAAGPGGQGRAQIVCASDACYTRENMDRDVLPTILWNGTVMRESLAALASCATRTARRCSTGTTRSSGRPRRAPRRRSCERGV
jgi:hypothetical protein